MRPIRAIASFTAALLLAASAHAETKIFIIANQADGYGVDRCLATGARCGAVVAAAYCRSQDFADARSFRKIEREEITGAVPESAACRGSCDGLVAIECTR